MKTKQVRQVEAVISSMSAEEIAAIHQVLMARERQVEGSLVVQERAASIERCPHCGHKAGKWGSKGGVPRFKCKNEETDGNGTKVCGKTFNAMTGSALAHLHYANLHIANAKLMIDGKPLREIAETLGISLGTAFKWRHRFLQAVRLAQPTKLEGIIEADETFFRRSFKGQRGGLPRPAKKRGTPEKKRGLSKDQIPVLVARDRAGKTTLSTVLPQRNAMAIEAALRGRVAPDAVLCSDGFKAYRVVAKNLGLDSKIVPPTPKGGIAPVPVSSKKRKPRVFHIQNVNAYHGNLQEWMFRFHGVATKYLENYVGWHRWLETNKSSQKAKRFLRSSLG